MEVHQSDPTSSDLRFDLELLGVPNTQSPVLSLSSSGSLSWSLAGATYVLETADTLTPPVSWIPFNPPITLLDGRFHFQTNPSDEQRYFRLKE